MKRVYEKPVLTIESFDVADVITASDGPNIVQRTLQQVGEAFENMIDNISETLFPQSDPPEEP